MHTYNEGHLKHSLTIKIVQVVPVMHCLDLIWMLSNTNKVLAKMESCFKDLMSKTFQWEKKGLLSKKRTKKGPVIELLRTFSRYFHNNAKRS